MGTLEVFHQLHCLDMIRRYTYPEFYPVDKFRTRKEFMRDHIEHCIDMLRQALMCFGDTGLVTFHWVEDTRVPVPDFNTAPMSRSRSYLTVGEGARSPYAAVLAQA
ncbi:hypothetical protein LZ32DRAFT_320239 [Colletotrichum eremochloae]|nr:hypothetical protein LZ32DRAFT_320239 [Colletotrichum eremochloae]